LINCLLNWLCVFTPFIIGYVQEISSQAKTTLAVGIYSISVWIQLNEAVGNYKDWLRKSERHEKLKLEELAKEMNKWGKFKSRYHLREEKKVKEDFEFERRERRRGFYWEVLHSFLLTKG